MIRWCLSVSCSRYSSSVKYLVAESCLKDRSILARPLSSDFGVRVSKLKEIAEYGDTRDCWEILDHRNICLYKLTEKKVGQSGYSDKDHGRRHGKEMFIG